MSINLIDNSKASVLDLIAVRPSADARRDASAPDPADNEGGKAFDDLLRDAKPRFKSSQDHRDAPAKEAEPVGEDIRLDDESEQGVDPGAEAQAGDNNDPQPEASAKQGEAGADQDLGKDGGDESLAQTPAQSVESETQSAQALAAALALTQQVDANAGDANAAGQQAKQAQAQGQQQAQAALAQAAAEAAQANKAQAAGPQTIETHTQAVQQTLQQGAQSDTGGETRGDAQTNAQSLATTTTQAASASVQGAAFSLGDASASDARLPLNPTTSIQQADAGKQAQAPLANATGDHDAVNTARINRGLANAVQQRGGAVTLRLTPPEMGTVRIQMQITGTNVSASFHAESSSAQTLLTQQLAQLRSSLESQGMNVERLSVQPLASTAQSQNANNSSNDNAQNQPQDQQQSAGDGRSRGQYSGEQGGGQSSDEGEADRARSGQSARGFFDRLSDAADQAA